MDVYPFITRCSLDIVWGNFIIHNVFNNAEFTKRVFSRGLCCASNIMLHFKCRSGYAETGYRIICKRVL